MKRPDEEPASEAAAEPKQKTPRKKKGEELPLPHLGKTALVALGVILLLGLVRDRLLFGLLAGLPLFLGLWFFHRSKSSLHWASGLRICGFLFGVTGVGTVMDTLLRPVGFTAFGMLFGLLLSWLFEGGASTDFT